MNISKPGITRAALENDGRVGDLYDARKDQFIGFSIFKERLPEDAVHFDDSVAQKPPIFLSRNLLGKFKAFGVDVEQQVSVISDLVPLKGSALYLEPICTPENLEERSLLYMIGTKQENLDVDYEDLPNLVDVEAVKQTEATHVVVGISWGASLILSLFQKYLENDDAKELGKKLSTKLKDLALFALGKPAQGPSPPENENWQGIESKVFADVMTFNKMDCPKTKNEACALLKKFQELVSSGNDEMIKPLSYHLMPIGAFMTYLEIQDIPIITTKAVGKTNATKLIKFVEEVTKISLKIEGLHQTVLDCKFELENSALVKLTCLKEEVALDVANMKTSLATNVLKLRSGTVDVKDVLDELHESKASPLNLTTTLKRLMEFVGRSELTALKEKVKHHGGKNLEPEDDLFEEIAKAWGLKVFALCVTKTAIVMDPNLWAMNRQVFVNEMNKRQEGCTYIVVDCDFHPSRNPNPIYIQIYQNGAVLTDDLLYDLELQRTIPVAKANIVGDGGPPKKRVPLYIPCVAKTCDPSNTYNWVCNVCLKPLEWGFDQFVYCKCGKAPAQSLEFRCTDPKHGLIFEAHREKVLAEILGKIEEPRNLNILILGETGVGKTTWINAFANFLEYETMNKARDNPLITLIPSKFTVCDENFEQIEVSTGTDANEASKRGQSATQEARIYPFQIGSTKLCLIDTPGIGDTRGIEQDRKNLKNILDTLEGVEELHGICILLKPNNARVTVMFRFCIKELLTHLHRDASKNIVFCFTNSRGTFYRPGDTMPALKEVLEGNFQVNIPLNKSTIYCFDSEAYRFLAALKNVPPVSFTIDEQENFSKSWEKSIEETERLLAYVRTLKPHPIRSTLNLNHSRDLVLKLTRPLAEISRNIQTNRSIVKDEIDCIHQTDGDIRKLTDNLLVWRTEIEVTRIPYPKTVCSNSNCVKIWTANGISTTEYVQVCHSHCYLSGVAQDSIGDPGLMRCWAMNGKSYCKHFTCGHNYLEHLHVYYDSKQVAIQVEDEAVKQTLQKNMSAKERKQAIIEQKNLLISEYENELKTIQGASVKFAYFLKTNAITPYNDGMEQYLKHLIHEEQCKVDFGGSSATLQSLNQSLQSYMVERKVLEEAMIQQGDGSRLSANEIDDYVNQLKTLKHSGQNVSDALDCVMKTSIAAHHSAFVVTHRRQPPRRPRGRMWSTFESFSEFVSNYVPFFRH